MFFIASLYTLFIRSISDIFCAIQTGLFIVMTTGISVIHIFSDRYMITEVPVCTCLSISGQANACPEHHRLSHHLIFDVSSDKSLIYCRSIKISAANDPDYSKKDTPLPLQI